MAAGLVDILESLFGGGPGDLGYGDPHLRVWVDDPSHAPAGTPTHRCPGGLHYYDVPLPDLDKARAPESFVYMDTFDPTNEATEHPYAAMAEKGGFETKRAVYISDPSEAPGDAEVNQDSQGRYYYVAPEDDPGWGGSGRETFEVPVWEPENVQNPQVGPLEGGEEGRWVGAPAEDIPVLGGELDDEDEDEDDKAWIPYQGPQGGEGWKNPETDEITYADEPPGEIVDPNELMDAFEEQGEGPPPDEFVELIERAREAHGISEPSPTEGAGGPRDTPAPQDGDEVILETEGQKVEGEVVFFDGDWVEIETEDGRRVEAPAEDVTEIVEEGEPVQPWDGPKHDPVEPSREKYHDTLEGVTDRTHEEFDKLLDNGHDPYDALTTLFNRQTAQRIQKRATREERYEDNNAPDHLDPTRAEDIQGLALDNDAESGITAGAMDVAEMPDGSRVYVTHVTPDLPAATGHEAEASTEDAEVAVGAAAAMEAMGFDVPDHHYEHNRFYAVEDAGGPTTNDFAFDPEASPDIDDERQAYRTMASQMLIGNADPHSGNVAVTDGKLVPFDLDMSGRDSSGWTSTGSPVRKASRTLAAADVDRDKSTAGRGEELVQTASELANEIDKEELLEQIPSREMRQTISDNIDEWRTR